MSRTFKDKPLHARATWWEPDHWGCENHTLRSVFCRECRTCDLPAEPDPSSYDRTARFGHRNTWHCLWLPVPDPLLDRVCKRNVPKWYVDHVSNNPNRRREREYNRRAIAEHRATGTVDTDLPGHQHRHRALWLWW